MIEDCRGLRYIAILIRDARPPAGPMHAVELAAAATGREHGPIELPTRDFVLDANAKTQLLSRLEEIATARDRACSVGDIDRAAALDAEYERISDEVTRAGSGRRGRRAAFTNEGEKARKAVSKAITEAIARIEAVAALAPLAHHLSSSVHKGLWLSYNGSDDWQIDLPHPLPRK